MPVFGHILYGSPQYCYYPHFIEEESLGIWNVERVGNLPEVCFSFFPHPGKSLDVGRSREDFGITSPPHPLFFFPPSFILQTKNWAMQPDRASGLPLGVRNCQHVRISGTRQWFKTIKGWRVMKPGMTWKIGAMGLVELTRRLIAFQGRQRDRGGRGGVGLRAFKSELLPSCVTLDKCLPLSEPPFSNWGNDTFLQGYWHAWHKYT